VQVTIETVLGVQVTIETVLDTEASGVKECIFLYNPKDPYINPGDVEMVIASCPERGVKAVIRHVEAKHIETLFRKPNVSPPLPPPPRRISKSVSNVCPGFLPICVCPVVWSIFVGEVLFRCIDFEIRIDQAHTDEEKLTRAEADASNATDFVQRHRRVAGACLAGTVNFML